MTFLEKGRNPCVFQPKWLGRCWRLHGSVATPTLPAACAQKSSGKVPPGRGPSRKRVAWRDFDQAPFAVKNKGFERFCKFLKRSRFRTMCFHDRSHPHPTGARTGAPRPPRTPQPAHNIRRRIFQQARVERAGASKRSAQCCEKNYLKET